MIDGVFEFLREFSELTPKEQTIFLYCLRHIPYPSPYSGDLAQIARATNANRNTVRSAFRSFARSERLNGLVRYVKYDKKKEFIEYELARQKKYQAAISAAD